MSSDNFCRGSPKNLRLWVHPNLHRPFKIQPQRQPKIKQPHHTHRPVVAKEKTQNQHYFQMEWHKFCQIPATEDEKNWQLVEFYYRKAYFFGVGQQKDVKKAKF